tara:strand:- start:1218 stop:1466 length:249 start_codon:yes stop_codon:yes gene_type:complete
MEAEFNDNQRSQKPTRRVRPFGLADWQWRAEVEAHKNRFYVGAKLKEKNWHSYMSWAKDNNFSNSSGLNRLIETHPDLKNHA